MWHRATRTLPGGTDSNFRAWGEETVYIDRGKGARIWDLVQSPIRVNRIHQALVEQYDVDGETVKQDLMEILDRLLAEGLVELRHEEAP